MTGNAAVPSQHAALAAMARHDLPPAETMDLLRRQRQLVSQALDKIPGIEYQLPGGAFYFLLDLRGVTKDSAKWCEDLLVEAGVALVPGETFSAPGFARLTFVADETTLIQALEQINKFVNKDPK
jgi:aspartate aminotransferase